MTRAASVGRWAGALLLGLAACAGGARAQGGPAAAAWTLPPHPERYLLLHGARHAEVFPHEAHDRLPVARDYGRDRVRYALLDVRAVRSWHGMMASIGCDRYGEDGRAAQLAWFFRDEVLFRVSVRLHRPTLAATGCNLDAAAYMLSMLQPRPGVEVRQAEDPDWLVWDFMRPGVASEEGHRAPPDPPRR